MLPNHDLERMIRARSHRTASAVSNKPPCHLPSQNGTPNRPGCPDTGVQHDGYAEVLIAAANGLMSIPDVVAPEMPHYSSVPPSRDSSPLGAVLDIGGLGHLGLQYARHMGLRSVAIGRGQTCEKLGTHCIDLLLILWQSALWHFLDRRCHCSKCLMMVQTAGAQDSQLVAGDPSRIHSLVAVPVPKTTLLFSCM
jgi:hypothetical protein